MERLVSHSIEATLTSRYTCFLEEEKDPQ